MLNRVAVPRTVKNPANVDGPHRAGLKGARFEPISDRVIACPLSPELKRNAHFSQQRRVAERTHVSASAIVNASWIEISARE